MSAPTVKGWCPGAYHPMMSGDGMIVRIRPFFARLDAAQVMGLCSLAQEYGNGFIDLTNRANLQIRGVAPDGVDALVTALADLNLLDATPEAEARRNVLVSPFWQAGDDTAKVAQTVLESLATLPELPAKFGIVVDTGAHPLLANAPGDIRIERGDIGLILRTEGATLGRPTTQAEIPAMLREITQWFTQNRHTDDRRMRHVLSHHALPIEWTTTMPRPSEPHPTIGQHPMGILIGAAFGQIDANALAQVMQSSRATGMRITPWRLFLLETSEPIQHDAFVTHKDDPLLSVDACPGAPACASAHGETRALARSLAGHTPGSLHISGCTKGCARSTPADFTIVARNGHFDLVRQGRAWDAPTKCGLRPQDIPAELSDSL